jgi:hypothetical protein
MMESWSGEKGLFVDVLPQVSVLLPTFEQCHFIRCALAGLLAQTLSDWEAIIIDDGSRDDTAQALLPYLADRRVHYRKLPFNRGLGHALNLAMDAARAPLLTYLPTDDLFFPDHLHTLTECLRAAPDAVLAYSGVRHHYKRHAAGQIPGYSLQLVQCMQRATRLRWSTRDELESDDLERLYWERLRTSGRFVSAGGLSCEWVEHAGQRHKRMREPFGGINPFRQHYRVTEPLRLQNSVGNEHEQLKCGRPSGLSFQIRFGRGLNPDSASPSKPHRETPPFRPGYSLRTALKGGVSTGVSLRSSDAVPRHARARANCPGQGRPENPARW